MIISVRSRKPIAIPDPNRNPERLEKAVHIVLVHSGRGHTFAHDKGVQMVVPAGNFAPLVHDDPIVIVAPHRTGFYL